MKNLNQPAGFAFRLLEIARGGRRRGPRALAAGATEFTCAEPSQIGQRVLKDAIDRAGY